ncbi:MAG: two-component system sensor histidine kinase NtrB [Bryobacteraceae bacterium]
MRWSRWVRPQDFIWILLFAALAVFSPERSPVVLILLAAIGAVQIFEPRTGAKWSILLNLALCYPLIYFGGGISSSFWMILLLPVISAATSFGAAGGIAVTLTACIEDLSFLLFVNWQEQEFVPGEQLELVLRLLLFPLVFYLTYQLAQGKREEARRYQQAAEQLAAANVSLKEAEAHLRRTERLAALGQLTAGLAHELRNPMGTMKTSAELLSRNVVKENEIAREMAGYIRDEVDRTNSLITRFLDFARPMHLKLEKGDLAALIDCTIDRFNRENSGRGVTVLKNYSPDIPPVAFDAELMERAILNLISNAAQASPAGSVVTVKTRPVNNMIEISVIDRGCGIEQKNIESVFNPFFTTKADGVGLGLAIVSKMVDEHGGQITVESTPGEGSVFRVFLPAGTQ